MTSTIYITSDHGGFELKNKLVSYLESNQHKVVDVGPKTLDPEDDYPDYALELLKKLRYDDMGVGIAICRSAQGMCMAMNRNPGMRAALGWSEIEAKKSRNHEDSNVLCLSADYITDEENFAIVDSWLKEEYLGQKEPRHARRLQKLESYFPL